MEGLFAKNVLQIVKPVKDLENIALLAIAIRFLILQKIFAFAKMKLT